MCSIESSLHAAYLILLGQFAQIVSQRNAFRCCSNKAWKHPKPTNSILFYFYVSLLVQHFSPKCTAVEIILIYWILYQCFALWTIPRTCVKWAVFMVLLVMWFWTLTGEHFICRMHRLILTVWLFDERELYWICQPGSFHCVAEWPSSCFILKMEQSYGSTKRDKHRGMHEAQTKLRIFKVQS